MPQSHPKLQADLRIASYGIGYGRGRAPSSDALRVGVAAPGCGRPRSARCRRRAARRSRRAGSRGAGCATSAMTVPVERDGRHGVEAVEDELVHGRRPPGRPRQRERRLVGPVDEPDPREQRFVVVEVRVRDETRREQVQCGPRPVPMPRRPRSGMRSGTGPAAARTVHPCAISRRPTVEPSVPVMLTPPPGLAGGPRRRLGPWLEARGIAATPRESSSGRCISAPRDRRARRRPERLALARNPSCRRRGR